MVDWEAHECATFNSPGCATKEETTLDILDVSDQRRALRKKRRSSPELKSKKKSSEVQHQEGDEGSKTVYQVLKHPTRLAITKFQSLKKVLTPSYEKYICTKRLTAHCSHLYNISMENTDQEIFYHRWEAHVQPVFFIHGSDRRHHIKLQDLTDECLPHGDCLCQEQILG